MQQRCADQLFADPLTVSNLIKLFAFFKIKNKKMYG